MEAPRYPRSRQSARNPAADVVIVGGGIAGASLAYALAREGVAVTVLERSRIFDDRVRGETMQPWGVAEARALGVHDALLAAGAHVNTTIRHFVAGFEEPSELPLSLIVPGVAGALNLAHPIACQALLDCAADVGATVLREVSGVRVTPGTAPAVDFVVGEHPRTLRTGVVVGADGRSSVVRRQVGIDLRRQEASSCIAGLLLDRLDGVPDDFDALVAGREAFVVLFHQGRGRARAYVVVGLGGQRRFVGANRVEAFLRACDVPPFPWRSAVAAALPAGPVRTYPGDDTWADEPYARGVVLIGDAAGYNDPILAQGLSIAMRDARTVRDLVLAGAHSPDTFRPYADERVARMARLRYTADMVAIAYAEDADNRDARRTFLAQRINANDPVVMTLLLGAFAGPEIIPDDLLTSGLLEEIRAAR